QRRAPPNASAHARSPQGSHTRVECILPTGGKQQAEIDERLWRELLDAVREHWPELKDANLDPGRGRTDELITRIEINLKGAAWSALLEAAQQMWPAALKNAKPNEIDAGNTAALIDTNKKQKIEAPDKELQEFIDQNYKLPSTREKAPGTQEI